MELRQIQNTLTIFILLHLSVCLSQYHRKPFSRHHSESSIPINLSHEVVRNEFNHFVASAGGIVNPSQNLPPKRFPRFQNIAHGFHDPHSHDDFHENVHFETPRNYGCKDKSGNFHFDGETWFTRGCRRHKCLHFRGNYFIETDSCDTEIHNTTYKCIIEVDIHADYPKCCPRYRCNPDNLGNRLRSTS